MKLFEDKIISFTLGAVWKRYTILNWCMGLLGKINQQVILIYHNKFLKQVSLTNKVCTQTYIYM